MGRLGKWLRGLFARREIPDVPADWHIAGGEGMTVCVLDSGLPDHPALAECLDAERSRAFDGERTDAWDRSGHSTAACGIVHAIAPLAKIVSYRISADGEKVLSADLRVALEAAAKLGPDVVYCGGAVDRGASKCLHSLVVLESLGVPVVCAAGNGGGAIAYPARFAQTISVGACDRRGKIAAFSPLGCDCYLPGVGVQTWWTGGGRAMVSGTCFAAACGAAVAALYLSHLRRHIGDGIPAGADLVAAVRKALAEVSA